MSAEDLAEAAERVIAAGALGRSAVLRRLFDFLLERSSAGAAPKETEVALNVFGDGLRFNPPQDSSVRVYVHRLRAKLTDYYAGPGRDDPVRLDIPRGEYRLVASREGEGGAPAVGARSRRLPGRPWMWIGAGLVALNLGLWALWAGHSADNGIGPERAAAPWSDLLKDHKPITLVLGDYYIFGDIDPAKHVDRLVREYAVNTPLDLDDYRMAHPEVENHYVDLDLYYLPISAAQALKSVMPLLAPTARDRDLVHVVLASDVTPDMLRRNNIVYVGYLSGLGILRDPVFAASRFSVGETYDVLIDQKAQRRYASQEGGPGSTDQAQRDLGYFSTFKGPNGNRIVIIAGARDMGVTQTAEEATSPEALKAMRKGAGGADAFEALYEVHGVRRSNLGGDLVTASPLDPDRIWRQQGPPQQFPPG